MPSQKSAELKLHSYSSAKVWNLLNHEVDHEVDRGTKSKQKLSGVGDAAASSMITGPDSKIQKKIQASSGDEIQLNPRFLVAVALR